MARASAEVAIIVEAFMKVLTMASCDELAQSFLILMRRVRTDSSSTSAESAAVDYSVAIVCAERTLTSVLQYVRRTVVNQNSGRPRGIY